MRLVLLPGLNGSSALFTPLLETLAGTDCWPLSLPEQGPQDYPSLADALFEQLGTTPFVLLGESFSGPLAYQFALRQPTGLQGLIFAASFLSRPNPALALLAHLPMPQALATQPWLLRALCLGITADEHILQQVRRKFAGWIRGCCTREWRRWPACKHRRKPWIYPACTSGRSRIGWSQTALQNDWPRLAATSARFAWMVRTSSCRHSQRPAPEQSLISCRE